MNNQGDGLPAGKGRTHWTPREHTVQYGLNFNSGMAEYIVRYINPSSVLEFGCGLGLYCYFLKNQLGIERVYGIEPEPMGRVFDAPDGPVQLTIDIFTGEHPKELCKAFDLVMSIEVAEHIPREKHDFLFDFLVAHASNFIVFSGARVGQGGVGHIAERPEQEWRDEFVSRGMEFQENMTKQIRAASNAKNVNHRKNVMIFKRTN